MEVIFKKLEKEESSKYRKMRLESLLLSPQSFGSSFEEERSVPHLRFEKRIEEASPDQYVFGAFLSGGLVGICGFIRDSQIKTKHKGTIVQLYVKPAHQGKGIGKELMNAIVSEAFLNKEIEQIILGVVVDNENAIKIYESLGFERFGLQQRYFKDGDNYLDELLMILYRENYACLKT
jgi:ribosomal protein S18 acetylase RimI-like enzyme